MANERYSMIGKIGGTTPVVPKPESAKGSKNATKVAAYMDKQKSRKGKWNSQVPTTSARKR